MSRSSLSAAAAVLGGLVTLAFGGAAGASAASTTTRDAASTRAFIGGELGVERATLAQGPVELAAGTAYLASVSADCGSTPLQLPSKLGVKGAVVLVEFAVETGVAFDDVTMGSARPTIDRIARADERLRFSDPTLQWTVHGATPALAAMLALQPPDICADQRRLAATKFTELTPAGARFARNALTLIEGQSTPGALIRQMRSYAPASVSAGLQRLKALSHRVSQLPVTRVEHKLLRVLFAKPTTGMPPSARVRSLLERVTLAEL